MEIRFRPLTKWPKESTKPGDKQNPRFFAPYEETIDLLIREASYLGAREIVIEAGFDERDIRLDGLPRAQATSRGDGIAVYLETKQHGPLMFATDVFTDGAVYRHGRSTRTPAWQNNLRAIALGMESLRKVDRYGITSHGEQYTGWKALGSGIPMGGAEPPMTTEEAAKILLDGAGMTVSGEAILILQTEPESRQKVYRAASRKHHPDAGGSDGAFALIEKANRVLSSG